MFWALTELPACLEAMWPPQPAMPLPAHQCMAERDDAGSRAQWPGPAGVAVSGDLDLVTAAAGDAVVLMQMGKAQRAAWRAVLRLLGVLPMHVQACPS